MLLLPVVWANTGERMVKTDSLKERPVRSYWNEAKARSILEAWQQSGETLAGFARQLGVNRKRLTRWASRLRVRESETITFHPVRLVGEDARGPRAAIEIEVGRRRVRVWPGFAADDLRRVLAVLEERNAC